jgi:hypothetical protein
MSSIRWRSTWNIHSIATGIRGDDHVRAASCRTPRCGPVLPSSLAAAGLPPPPDRSLLRRADLRTGRRPDSYPPHAGDEHPAPTFGADQRLRIPHRSAVPRASPSRRSRLTRTSGRSTWNISPRNPAPENDLGLDIATTGRPAGTRRQRSTWNIPPRRRAAGPTTSDQRPVPIRMSKYIHVQPPLRLPGERGDHDRQRAARRPYSGRRQRST